MRVDKLQLKIDEEEVADLRRRLEGFRMPDEGPGGESWDYGLPLGFAEKLHKYWLEDFDWAAAEQKINSFRHFRAILGKDFLQIGIHFIFALPEQDQGKLPIMLVHGWPGSFWEFHDVIPKLVAAGYPVVVPSLPGYGFSDPPQDRGWSTLRVAAALDSLMKGLGYPRYYAQGGDWGGVICRILGSKPQKFGCVAIHLNFFPCGKPKGFDMSTLSKEDVARLDRAREFARSGSGYQAIQGTRPQTLAYGLTDSPMGLACWIAEKFSAWADTQGTRDLTKAISLDDMLTNICIYWFTYSIASSTRLYFETLGSDILAFFDTKPQMSRSSSPAAKL
ncbi:Epoxide hydrolase 1 [Hondaea fermentalgiana]|uniref:Epoxide hydrolase 1 n=1 Tax=Hondaea fermentalgiana TaxID=2315210 RepID=A0A2R5G4Z3_9STRA|nr:Epoxide hydrolase 1 [Hondaea fermentalgiana]|eukprot:GBG26096.1 Epoxide hydrolase 1 [Hondaea fermentalgiana]